MHWYIGRDFFTTKGNTEMAETKEILYRVWSGIKDNMAKCGFDPVIPSGCQSGELPCVESGGKITVDFKGADRAVRLEYFDAKLNVLGCLKEGTISDGDFAPITQILVDVADSEGTVLDKQVKYFINEISDSVSDRFGKDAEDKYKRAKKVKPATVSRKAVENGSASYDPLSLANRFVGIYKELSDVFYAYNRDYDAFLADEFFTLYGNKVVLDAIKRNNADELKKLFTIFNEMYLDGTGETQSLICVTILGSLNNDQELLATAIDYMCNELMVQVINVNKVLGKSKSSRMRLENPPAYKPKKKKAPIGSRIGQ